MNRRRTLRAAAAAGAAALAAAGIAGCGGSDSGSASSGSGTASKEPLKASIMLEYPANASQIWTFSGEARGTFKAAGIEPDIKLPDSGATPVKALQAGKVDFALQLSTGGVVTRGKGAPIKAIGTLEILPLGLMVLDDKVATFKDIKGKKVGLSDQAWEQACFDRMLTANGMTRKDVDVVNPGVNLVTPLLQGKLAGANGSQYEQAIILAATGKKTKIFRFDQVCPSYPISILTTEKMTKEHPDTVKAMLKGISDSLAWSMDNQQEAADLYAKKFPEQDKKSNFAQWQASAPTFCTEDSSSKGLLWPNSDQYQQLIDLVADSGDIPKKYPVTDLVDTSFLPTGSANNASACANDRYKLDPLAQITGL
jgi:ABC-type nitrate/sulfonate/bicarbonate transport system substrate-binding protein